MDQKKMSFVAPGTIVVDETKPQTRQQEKTCWDYVGERIETPSFLPIVPADAEMMQVVEKFTNDPTVTMFYEPNDETDYVMWGRDKYGKATAVRVSECVSINGVQYFIYPGKNSVPKTVYEFLLQQEDTRKRTRIKPGVSNCIGEFSR